MPPVPPLCRSLGVNLGEAVNFAPPDWLRFGAAALGRLRHFRKPCVVSQEEMLLRVAAQQAGPSVAAMLGSGGAALAASPASPTGASPLVCYHLARELRRVVEEEWTLRAKLWSEGGQAVVGRSASSSMLPGAYLITRLCVPRASLGGRQGQHLRLGQTAGTVLPGQQLPRQRAATSACAAARLLRRPAPLAARAAGGGLPGR